MRSCMGLASIVLVCAVGFAQEGGTAKEPAPATPAPNFVELTPKDAAPQGTARMVLSPTVFDFGTVLEHQPAVGEFTIKNVGDAPLTIASKSSCGCTVATRPKSPLAPGEETRFTITYSTKRAGKANKKITLTTNDPTQPTTVINVVGEVKAVFTAAPSSMIIFRDAQVDSRDTVVTRLTNSYTKPVQLKLKDDPKRDKFAVELKEIKPGMEYELQVTTLPPLVKGLNRTTVVLETGLPEAPTLEYDVTANVRPRVAFVPPQLYVTSSMTKPVERFVQVQYRADKPVKITDIKVEPETVKAELFDAPAVTRGRSAFHRIRVTLPAFEDLPPQGGMLTVLTDDESPEFQKLQCMIVRRVIPQRPAAPAMSNPKGARRISPAVDASVVRRQIDEGIKDAQAGGEDTGKKNAAKGPPAKPLPEKETP